MKNRNKKIWIISHSFPPSSEVGGIRPLGLCRYLEKKGWRITVICAEPKNVPVDRDREAKIPSSVKVIRTEWIELPVLFSRFVHLYKHRKKSHFSADRITEPKDNSSIPQYKSNMGLLRECYEWCSLWLHVPDGRNGWFFSAVFAGIKRSVTKANRPDVIWATGPSWTSLLIGLVLSMLLKVPFVADFRDPWVGSAFHKSRRKYKAHTAFHRFLENRVVKGADFITCAWNGIRGNLINRYPDTLGRIETIVNGYDPEDFKNIPEKKLSANKCVFLHAGGFHGPRTPIPLLEALKIMRENEALELEHSLFVFLGNPIYRNRPLADIVDDYSLNELVKVLPAVPQRKAFSFLKGSQIAMLFGQSGSTELASIPGKSFEYMGLRKPVLAIGTGEEACSIIEAGGCQIWRAEADNIKKIADAIKQIVQLYFDEKLIFLEKPVKDYTQNYMAEKIERRLLQNAVK